MICSETLLYQDCPLILDWVLNPDSKLLDLIFEERRQEWLEVNGFDSMYDRKAYDEFMKNPTTMFIPRARGKPKSRIRHDTRSKTDNRNNSIWRGRMEKLDPIEGKKGPW